VRYSGRVTSDTVLAVDGLLAAGKDGSDTPLVTSMFYGEHDFVRTCAR
jgi:hypothetical protein